MTNYKAIKKKSKRRPRTERRILYRKRHGEYERNSLILELSETKQH